MEYALRLDCATADKSLAIIEQNVSGVSWVHIPAAVVVSVCYLPQAIVAR